MTPLLRASICLTSALLLIGCAAGNKIPYSGPATGYSLTGEGPVAVATHDGRPYVVSESKPVTFVGLQRGGYGNPFNVTTASGRALAHDFDETLVATLRAAGFDAKAVTVAPSESKAAVIERLRQDPSQRSLVVALAEWKSDTYNNTKLMYDVAFEVYGADGELLGGASFEGSENLGGSFMNPPAHAKQAVPEAYRRLIGQWLSDPRIASALH